MITFDLIGGSTPGFGVAVVIAPALFIVLSQAACTTHHESGCEYTTRDFRPEDSTPWGSTFSDDAIDLSGTWAGTLEWRSGGKYIEIDQLGTVALAVTINIDAVTATGKIPDGPGGGRLACPEEYSLAGQVSMITDDESLIHTFSIVALRVAGGFGGYSIDQEFQIDDLEGSAIIGPSPESADDYNVQFHTFLTWSEDRSRVSGDIYATGSTPTDAPAGYIFNADIATFSGQRVSSRTASSLRSKSGSRARSAGPLD